MSAKQAVLEAINRLPDHINYKDIVEEVSFLAALEEAEEDIQDGRVVSNEAVLKQLEKMDFKIIWTEKSLSDLEAIVRYVSRISKSPEIAKNLGFGLYQKVQILSTHPEVGSVLLEKNDPLRRKLIYKNWKIVYRVDHSHRVV